MASASSPIGVFDSGLGGLSVLREIRRILPCEDLIYVADSGYAPYGERPRDYIDRRTHAMVDFLVSEGVKAVVVACNTATSVSVDGLRARLELPIVAIEPAIKPAAAHTQSGVVGVLATTQTLAGSKFAHLVAEHARDVQVLSQPCPGLVERVEAGDLWSEETRALVERYVPPLITRGADTLVLGCTHYPFVRALVEEVAGPSVTVIDSAAPVAQQLRRRLADGGLLRNGTEPGRWWLFTTGLPERVGPVARLLLESPVDVRPVTVAGSKIE
jgi:glutamate racemase